MKTIGAGLVCGCLVLFGGAFAACAYSDSNNNADVVRTPLVLEDAGGATAAAPSGPRGDAPVMVVAPPKFETGGVPGYVHSRGSSNFAPGPHEATSTDNMGIVRTNATNGVIAQFPNGFFAARPAPGSELRARGPLTGSGVTHDLRVRSYFASAGLPLTQVGRIQAHAIMQSAGTEQAGEQQRQHLGFVSVIERLADGMRVEGSYAWAEFNASDEVVAESIWWPPIPAATLAQAQALRQQLAVAGAAGLRAKLPAQHAAIAEVVIHHSAPIAQKWFATATVDAQGADDAAPVSYDEFGGRVNLNPPAPPPLPRP